MPAFNIRNSAQIDQDLKEQAIINGFVSIPLYNYFKGDKWQNGVAGDSCTWANDVDMDRWQKDSTYNDVQWIKDKMRD